MAEISKPDYTNIWASGGAIIAPSTAKVTLGWTAEIPPHQWENWAQNRQDEAIAYLFQHGIPEWDSTTEYFTQRSVVQYGGKLYIATADNVNDSPADGVSWGSVAGSIENDRVGSVVYYASNNIPDTCLVCDGSEVSRTTYSRLFDRIGTTWGVGDGSSTFNLPNLTDGKFIRSTGGNASPLGSPQASANLQHTHTGTATSAGLHTHTGTADSGGGHTHDVSYQTGTAGDGAGVGSGAETQTSTLTSTLGGTHSHNVTLANGGAHTHTLSIANQGDANEARPYNVAMVPVIFF